uniref:Centrosomal protein of 19 kDa n=1 Tax=Labrus bergylta TaxID=56723 RepID=A0A3Q3F4I4_9LABR
MSFKAKRCGVQFSPPSIVLIYQHKDNNSVRKRIIPVRNFSKYSGKARFTYTRHNNPRHRDYLDSVSHRQLEKLHMVLRDHMKGFSLEHSLASFHLDPEEDLNKLDDRELTRRKEQMDELFEKNRRHKDDPDFVYDLEMDFTKTSQEKCSWDEESDDGF